MSRKCIVFICIQILSSCSLFEKFEYEELNKDQSAVIERANVMLNVEWSPIRKMPKNSGYYETNVNWRGCPYSSVKKIETYLGYDVSLYTFLSALNNPYSRLYTEDLRKPEYFSTNASTYYGVVCSSFASYALGLPYPLSTAEIPNHKDFMDIGQNIDDLQSCDLVRYPGHVVLVVNIKRDSTNSISNILIAESTASGTSQRRYSRKSFIERFSKYDWSIY